MVQKVYNYLTSENDFSTKSVNEKTLSDVKYILKKMHIEIGKTQKRVDRKKGSSSYFELTPRELEVLTWLSRGFNYDETAEHLYISKNTLKTHLKRVYSKLEVDNRLQAVNKAKEIGLLP